MCVCVSTEQHRVNLFTMKLQISKVKISFLMKVYKHSKEYKLNPVWAFQVEKCLYFHGK